MKQNKFKPNSQDIKKIYKKFSSSRQARLKKMSKMGGLPCRGISAARNRYGPQIVFTNKAAWQSKLQKEFQMKGLKQSEASAGWIMHQRRTAARHCATILANRVFDNIEKYFAKVQHLTQAKTPASPTAIVVLDMNKNLPVYNTLKKTLVNIPKDAPTNCLFGQYLLQDGEQSKVQDLLLNYAVPLMVLGMETIVDRPENFWPTANASVRKAFNIFLDREGICTATLQMLDQMLERNKSSIGVQIKLIVAHGSDTLFDNMLDFVNCAYSDIDAAIKSRIYHNSMV